jgi:hypothetical protein
MPNSCLATAFGMRDKDTCAAAGDMDCERSPIPQSAVLPSSTNGTAGLRCEEASSEAEKRIAAATSAALPGRFSMVPCAAAALYCSTVSPEAASAGWRSSHSPGQQRFSPSRKPVRQRLLRRRRPVVFQREHLHARLSARLRQDGVACMRGA